MADRSADEVRRELESERERLGEAVHRFRSQAVAVRRRLPLVAAGAAGLGLLARTVSGRVSRRAPKGKERRARLPFLRRN